MSSTRRPKVRADWTEAQAIAAQRRFHERGGKASDPAGPLKQWWAMQALEEYERRHKAGDKRAVLDALAACFRTDVDVPAWLKPAYLGGYYKVTQHHARSWDDAFGEAHDKGAHLAALRRQSALQPEVWQEVENQVRAGAVEDDALFEAVGKQLDIGKTTVKKYNATSPYARRRKKPKK